MSATAVDNRRPGIGMAIRAGAVTFGGQALLSAAATGSLAEETSQPLPGDEPVPDPAMQRKMLLGIKARPEAPARAAAGDP